MAGGYETLLHTLGSQVRAAATLSEDQSQSPSPRALSPAQTCTLLKMNLQMLASMGGALHPSTALKHLHFASPFSNLRLHPNHSISRAVAATYLFFLQHSSPKVAHESHLCVRKELELLSGMLSSSPSKGGATTLDSFKDGGVSDSEVVTLMRFDLMILLVSLREYTPESTSHARELATFLLETLNPFTTPVQRFVELQLAIIQALRRVFSWISPEDEEFIGVMCQGLHPHSSLPLKFEVLDWIRELPSSFKVAPGVVSALISAASDREVKLREQVGKTFHQLLEKRSLSSEQIHAVATAAFGQISDPEPGVQTCFSKVLACCGSVHHDEALDPQKNWRYLLSVKRFSAQLTPPQVLTILNFVFQRPQALPTGWLQRVVFSCLKSGPRRTSPDEKSNDIIPLDESGVFELLESWCSGNNMASAWFMIQEVARHCVSVRFRTHLGGPTQTFATVERMLLDLPQLEPASGSQLLPMRLLLELVESLQRNIYNAFEGSLVLEAPPSSSIHFFRANKKVCEEWFARIREPLVNASSSIQCHFGTAYYSMFRLIDLRPVFLSALRAPEGGVALKTKLQQDVSRVLRSGSLALCKMQEGDSILGLQSWVATAFGASAFDDGAPAPVHKVNSPQGALGWMNGLAFEARGQYERAAAQYMQLLSSEETLSGMGADGVQFTIARLVESYVALSDWGALESWLLELQSLRTKHAGKSFTGALTTAGIDMNSIHAWARFDEGDIEGTWGYLDLTPQSSCEITLDPRQALHRSEQMILQAMIRKEFEREETMKDIRVARAILEGPLLVSALDGFPEASPFITQLHCIDLVESCRGFTPESNRVGVLHDTAVKVFKDPVNLSHQDCHLWLKLLRVYKASFSESEATLKLREQVIRLARKHHNFRLARRLLRDAGDGDLEMVSFESTRLLFSEGDHQKAITSLWSTVKRLIYDSRENGGVLSENLRASTACLKLASWLKKTRLEPEFFSSMEFQTSSGVIEVMGAASKAATIFTPTSKKAWFSYANWCYLNARGSFFGSEVVSRCKIFPGMLDKEILMENPSLTSEEVSEVHRLISGALSEEVSVELEATIAEMLLKRVMSLMEAAAGDPGFEKWDGESPAILLASQLRQELQLLKPGIVSGLINELMQVWWGLRRRRVALVGVAAQGFLKYLSMAGGINAGCSRGDSMLNASLYVLRILQAFGVELEDTLQAGLRSVPPSAWQEITPQLFACLSSHPEAGVRKQLEGLLISLANVYPSAIVYPTLVHLSASEGQSSQELEHILGSLVKLHPKVVNDVRLMIAELGSITFLWEEQWLTTIQDLHGDVTRRINTLKEEATRIAENQTLSIEEKARINAAKYSAIMAPVALALERRLSLTSRPPETPHEAWFQHHFLGQLRSAIASFKSPPSSPSLTTLADAWKPFDSIATSLANHHKRSGVLLRDVSPRLSALRHSDAPMPGLESFSQVSVESFSEQVVILATKTKPKKVSVTGSDGRVYTYLLKGREDLRLDARIMQLLRASNRMLQASSLGGSHEAIRCYSVTPISGRAGLIQWVDGVTSLYSVYKAWQLRAHAAGAQQGSSSGAGGVASAVPRPSDMFYGKLIPALKSRKVVSRREWPQDVKRKVLVELMKETPSQILYRELWCASDGLKGFHNKIKRYSSSVAVMSMIGYVLGLGDRHLDNILIDFSSGEVVHIDYNICFEKGLRLKVPEIVPFRLTQIMQAALGPTGVEGNFRAECEAVLKTLQKNKELILLLLEAFIWDPLVEWLRGDGHDEATIGGEERKGMELAVSLSLFASHVQENRVALQEHHDELLWNLPVVASSLQAWISGYEKFERCSSAAIQANEEKLRCEQAELTAKTYLSEASAALEKAHLNYELQARELTQAKSLISEAARETTQWIEQRTRILDSLRNDTASELQALTQLAFNSEAVQLIPAVQSSGVSISVLPEPTQAHCKEVDKEVSQFAMARHEALLHAGITLQAYSLALQRLLPGNYHTTSFVHSWAQILQLLSRQMNPETLGVSKRQGLEIIARNRGEHDELICQKHEKLRRRVEKLTEEVQKLENDRLQLESSLDPDAERKAKDRLIGIFLRSLQSGRDEGDDHQRLKVMGVFRSAAGIFYSEIGEKLASLQAPSTPWCFSELEELAERCILVSDILSEIQEVSGGARASSFSKLSSFTSCLVGVDHLVKQMLGVVLPETLKAALSRDPAVIEAFAGVSRIRGALDSALEQVSSIEAQKASLLELERSYPGKIDEILQRKASLEEAAAGNRDDLSWEEAEELATQEEICRDQLEKLQKAWAQRAVQASGVRRMESIVQSSLEAAEERFEALVALETGDLHLMRGKVLLAAFANLFSGLEALDAPLGDLSSSPGGGGAGLQGIWKSSGILKQKTFFVWKLHVMDSLLECSLRDAAGDPSLSLDELVSQQRRSLEAQLQGLLDVYLGQRFAPAFLEAVLEETHALKAASPSSWSLEDEASPSSEPLRKACRLLRDYCDVHGSVRDAKSSAETLGAQAEEAGQALHNSRIEMARMEWLHDSALASQMVVMPGTPGGFCLEQGIWSRKRVLENIRGSIAAISRATEGLQKSELASAAAEEKLERTMGWVAGSGGRGSSGVSQEFRECLRRRKQLLWTGQEQAIALVRICVAVLEFEASREGYLESSSMSSSGDGKAWQQAYQKLIGRLETAFISFTSCDAEWKSAEKSLEAASASLSNVLKELEIVSAESDSRGAELQTMLSEMKQLTIEASTSVSGICKVLRTHSALTSEAAILDEVASLTEAAEAASDVHSLAREAIAERKRLISELKKVHNAVVPLEPLLSSTTNALNNESDLLTLIKSGQSTLLQALDLKMKEALSELPSAGSNVLDSAQKLHLSLTSLGRAASVDAGGITKATEAAEESQPVSLSTEDGLPPETSPQPVPDRVYEPELVEDDEAWISPPGTQSEASEGGSSSDQQPESQHSDQKPVTRSKGAPVDGAFVFNESDKVHSGEARSGHEQKQHSSKGSSSNVMSLPQSANVDYHSRVVRGTAVNVLKRVRTKLEGRDIDETGQLSVAEQVDHLLRQATSVNNLCNMYEGWTPWI